MQHKKVVPESKNTLDYKSYNNGASIPKSKIHYFVEVVFQKWVDVTLTTETLTDNTGIPVFLYLFNSR